MLIMPKYYDSEYYDSEKHTLKEGAPKELRDEFNNTKTEQTEVQGDKIIETLF